MSMLFQSGALFSDMSVAENVAFPLREKTRLDRRLIEAVALMKLQRVGLRGAAALMPAELSGGMARRVALARAIAFDPELMIYDEPFTGQDPISLGVLTRLVRDLNDGLRMTSFVVSHDIAEVSKIADRILLFPAANCSPMARPPSCMRARTPWCISSCMPRRTARWRFIFLPPIMRKVCWSGCDEVCVGFSCGGRGDDARLSRRAG